MQQIFNVITIENNNVKDITTFDDNDIAIEYFKLLVRTTNKKFLSPQQKDPSYSYDIEWNDLHGNKTRILIKPSIIIRKSNI